MENAIFQGTVQGQYLKMSLPSRPQNGVIENAAEYYTGSFTFAEGKPQHATVYFEGKDHTAAVILDDDGCFDETKKLTLEEGGYKIYCWYGYTESQRITTNCAYVRVDSTGDGVSDAAEGVNLTLAEQLTATVNKAVTDTNAAIETANAAADNANGAAQEVQRKLDAGELKGDKGEKGDKGDKGEKGDKGDPGSTEVTAASIQAALGYLPADPASIPTKSSQLINDSGYIGKDATNLTNYTLSTDTGHSLTVTVDPATYVMTLQLNNPEGTALSTQTVDLPLETMVVSCAYDKAAKELVITLKNGDTTRVSVADLVSGLATEAALSSEADRAKAAEKANSDRFADYRTSADQDAIDAGKQDTIADLEAIRSGAEKGTSAETEMADARTGKGGAVYASLKARLDRETGLLEEALEETDGKVEKLSVGTFESTNSIKSSLTWQKGLINRANNTIAASETFAYAEFTAEEAAQCTVEISGLYVRITELTADDTFVQLIGNQSFHTTNYTFSVIPGYKYRMSLGDNTNKVDEYLSKWLDSFEIALTVSTKETFVDRIIDTVKEKLKSSFSAYGCASIFNTIGCIGDSLTGGTSNYDGGSGSYPNYSYPVQLQRLLKNTIYNWGNGGKTAQSWKSTEQATECFDGAHLCDAYIIGLGTNELGGGKYVDESGAEVAFSKGTSADVASGAITFWGEYGRLIESINALFGTRNKPKIFVLSLETVNANKRFSQITTALQEMAAYYDNVYYIDIYSGLSDWCPDACWTGSTHKNALGYYRKALAINEKLNECISDHFADFANAQLINQSESPVTT